jgi:hypothetical protein
MSEPTNSNNTTQGNWFTNRFSNASSVFDCSGWSTAAKSTALSAAGGITLGATSYLTGTNPISAISSAFSDIPGTISSIASGAQSLVNWPLAASTAGWLGGAALVAAGTVVGGGGVWRWVTAKKGKEEEGVTETTTPERAGDDNTPPPAGPSPEDKKGGEGKEKAGK